MYAKLPCLNLYLAQRLRNYATYYCLVFRVLYLFSIFFAPPCCYKLCIHQLIFILVSMILIFLYIVIIALGQQQHSKHHFGSQLIGAVVRGEKCSKAKNCLPKIFNNKFGYSSPSPIIRVSGNNLEAHLVVYVNFWNNQLNSLDNYCLQF